MRCAQIFCSAIRAIGIAGVLPGLALAATTQSRQPADAGIDSEASIIEEVVVTAEFRPVQLEDATGSVSVVSITSQATTVRHLEEVLGQVANVNFSSGASRARFPQIRGIGERGQFAEPINPSVGLVIDGVDMSGIGTAATLFDVSQVEVLRGPQGTLYGANGLAGLINVVTPEPMNEHGGYVRAEAGRFSALGLGGVVSGPLGDDAGYRIAAQRFRDDGYVDNTFLHRDDTNQHDERTVRGKLVWRPSDSTRVQLVGGHVEIDNGYDAFSLDNNRKTRSDEPGRDAQETAYGSISMDAELSSAVLLQASIGLADSNIDYGYDEDWAFAGFDPIGYTSTDRYLRDRTTTTLEARLLSGDWDQSWDWVLGVYSLDQDVDLTRRYTFNAGDFVSDYSVERLAFYGEVGVQLSERIRLTVGGRSERHQSQYDDNNGARFRPEDDLVGGRVIVDVQLDSGAKIYAGVTRGYKAGGFNTDGSLPVSLREFAPESLLNYEVGLRHHLLDNRLFVRAAVFYMDRRDMQVSTSKTVPQPTGPAVEFVDFIDNAASGVNTGLEVEAEFVVTETVSLYGSIGYLDTELQGFVNPAGQNLDGRDQAQAPRYQFFVGSDWQLGDGWSARVEVEGRDNFYFSDSHSEQSDAYQLLHASLSYRAHGWEARVWGRNLTDEDTFVRGFFFGNDPRDGYTARGFTQLGEPRQAGVTLTAYW